jgi:hypothetical protein
LRSTSICHTSVPNSIVGKAMCSFSPVG